MKKKIIADNQNDVLPAVDLSAQAAEYLAGWQRAKADYTNLLRDLDARKKDITEAAGLNLILGILPVHLNFKTALQQIPAPMLRSGQAFAGMTKGAEADWITGIKHIKNQLDEFLKNLGVMEVSASGQFDPAKHEAISQEQHEDLPDGEIIREVEGGYMWKDKVIKPARVIVNVK